MPISVNTSKQQVQAVVTDDKVTATVSSGFGPTGPQGGSGVVAVTAPVTNSGTSTSANIGLSVGTGLQVSSGSLAVTYGTSSTAACAGDDARLSDSREWSAATVTQADAEAGTSTSRFAFTPLRVFQAIAAWWNASAAKTKLDGIASGATANATDAQLRDRSTHTGTQAISTVTGLQTALDGKQTSGTYATLVGGKVPAEQLPSYVDDIIEAANVAALPGSGSAGVLYVTLDTNKVYRWSGSTYVEVSAGASAWGDITGKPTFAAVATSGAYADLSGTPSPFVLPTATASVLGGVKIGTGVTIADGVISVSTDYAASSDFDQGVKTTDDVEFSTARLTNGDTQAYNFNKTQLKFEYFDGGYSHWVSTTHNAGTAAGNRILFHTNNGTAAGTFPLDAVLGLTIENGGIIVGSEGVTFHDNTKQTTAFTGAIDWADITSGVPSTFTPSAHNHAASEITSGTLDAARLPLATTGAAGAIIVGSGLSVSSGTLSAAVTSVAGRTGAVTIAAADVSGLATIATSGSASDLSAGTIPIARIPTGTTSSTVCLGSDSRLVSDGNKGDITVGSSNTSWTINAGAVVTADLADSAVTTEKIANSAVTLAKTTGIQKAITSGTAAPTGGSDGDIYLQYT